MEKVCSKLGLDTILSADAVSNLRAAGLAEKLPCESVGRHSLEGFSGQFELFKLSVEKEHITVQP